MYQEIHNCKAREMVGHLILHDKVYKSKTKFLRAVESGDYLEYLIYFYPDEIDLIYKIAERITPRTIDDSLGSAIRYLPKEEKLQCILAEKLPGSSGCYLNLARWKTPGNTKLLEILKKKI